MKTKIISILIVLLLSAIFATAQYAKNISFSLLGGFNIQNLYGKDTSGRKLGNELIPGFHAGANIQIPVAREFYFQPGLLFSTKGRKKSHYTIVTTGQTTTTIKNITTTKLAYIELPLNIVYKTSLGRGYFMLGLGPYVGYAILGMEQTRVNGEYQRKNIEFRNVVEANDPLLKVYYKAFDAGGNIFIGGELARVFAQINFQVGMININPKYKGLTDDKSMSRNIGFELSLGYRF